MKRFQEAADTWMLVAKLLPGTLPLRSIVENARLRAEDERNANRWDELWEQVARLPIPFGQEASHFLDRKLQVRQFMNQSTNLVEIENVVLEFERELEAYRRIAMQNSDAPQNRASLSGEANPRAALTLLAELPQSMRVRIPAERVPYEYQQSISPELQERLRGLTSAEAIISEMNVFYAERLNRRNQNATAAMTHRPPEPLPRNIRREWLPLAWNETIPVELRSRFVKVRNQAEFVQEMRRYEAEESLRRATEEAKDQLRQKFEPDRPNSSLTGPPVQIEIIPTQTGKP
jgi:hypothetical protein